MGGRVPDEAGDEMVECNADGYPIDSLGKQEVVKRPGLGLLLEFLQQVLLLGFHIGFQFVKSYLGHRVRVPFK